MSWVRVYSEVGARTGMSDSFSDTYNWTYRPENLSDTCTCTRLVLGRKGSRDPIYVSVPRRERVRLTGDNLYGHLQRNEWETLTILTV